MEQGSRLDSTPVSAGHDTTDRGPGDAGRDAAITKMLTAAPPSNLAQACAWAIDHYDFINTAAAAKNWDDARTDREIDKVGHVIRRAIREPSECRGDTIAKARLALAELLDAELPFPDMTEEGLEDHVRLVIVTLREVTGGAAADDSTASPTANTDRHDYAFHGASTELRLATRDHERLVNAADGEWVRQNGGDTSVEAMAPAIAARDAASTRQDQAWRDLFKVRPRTNHQMWLLLRDVAEHFDSHQGIADEPDVFGALVGAADGLRMTAPELVAPHDLTQLCVWQLEELADICHRQVKTLRDANRGRDDGTFANILDDEQYRIGRLGGMASAEIERRVPVDKGERDLRLETLIRAELSGNGYIEPALLAEAVAAWGAR